MDIKRFTTFGSACIRLPGSGDVIFRRVSKLRHEESGGGRRRVHQVLGSRIDRRPVRAQVGTGLLLRSADQRQFWRRTRRTDRPVRKEVGDGGRLKRP
jgi:hypothetical protein